MAEDEPIIDRPICGKCGKSYCICHIFDTPTLWSLQKDIEEVSKKLDKILVVLGG